MSGHSKWHKIQHKKGKTDAGRGAIFTKLCKAISMTASHGGDPGMNFALRLAIEKAKAENVPKENIERAVRRGTGEDKDGIVLEEALYEGFGPGGVGILVKTVSDNKNRTVSEVKYAFSRNGGSMGGAGSVKWLFEEKGVAFIDADACVSIQDWDEFELAIIEVGADEMDRSEAGLVIASAKENFKAIIDILTDRGIMPSDSGLRWMAKDQVSVDGDTSVQVSTLCDALEELGDVEEVFVNL
jgi:YebC/PmpR family DNA-binding regulatory protein